MSDLQIILDFLVESTPLESLPDADIILVCGHYEPKIAEHAAKLWRLGKAGRIVLSGKGRDKIPSGYSTEADFYRDIVAQGGVCDEAIVLEKEATNSLENILFGMRIIMNPEHPACERPPRSVIICAMPPLLRRTLATFRKQFPDVVVHGSACEIPDEWITSARVRRLLGEFDRLHAYAKKGDIVPVEVPNDVLAAVDRLRTENC